MLEDFGSGIVDLTFELDGLFVLIALVSALSFVLCTDTSSIFFELWLEETGILFVLIALVPAISLVLYTDNFDKGFVDFPDAAAILCEVLADACGIC